MSFRAEVWRHRLRVLEAILLLFLALFLVHFVPLRWWRATLGAVDAGTGSTVDTKASHSVTQAVKSACLRFSFEVVCLPRAMAVQWMLGIRRQRSALVFGIAPGQESGDLLALHAWVEAGDRILIGDDGKIYHRGLVLSR